MREIKFRGKRLDNGKWVIGSLIECGITGKSYIFPIDCDANESDKVGEEGCLRLLTFEVISETVGQYTGLKDKNGKEIYEGDIVIMKDEPEDIGSVAWDSHDMEWVISMGTAELKMGGYWSYELEVIGNIYDNPELMEEVE